MAREFILTGAPGAGKTLILRQLEVEGIDIIEEAATDVIALAHGRGIDRPWEWPAFVETIATLQMLRAARPAVGAVRVADRSLVCTIALAEYLGHPVPAMLDDAVRQAIADGAFERRVLFVELLGFITNTEARRISFEDSQRFEQFHIAAYERLGFELVRVPPMPIDERAALVRSLIGGMNGD